MNTESFLRKLALEKQCYYVGPQLSQNLRDPSEQAHWFLVGGSGRVTAQLISPQIEGEDEPGPSLMGFKVIVDDEGVILPTRLSYDGVFSCKSQEELRNYIALIPPLPKGLRFRWEDSFDEEKTFTLEAK